MDDTTMKGGSLRMLNVIDEYTREYLCIHVERRLNGAKVKEVMERLVREFGAPYIVPIGRTVGTAGENAVKIVVGPETNEIITSDPVTFP